jgi:hypothetical protein
MTPAVHLNPLRTTGVCLAAAALCLVIPFTDHALLYGLVIGLLFACVGPIWYRWQAGSVDAFETIHVIGLLYFVLFGLGAIWAVHDPVRVAYDQYLVPYMPQAVLYCLLGFLALLGGYFGPWFRKSVSRQTTLQPKGVLFLLVPGAVGFVGGLAEVALSRSRWLGQSLSGLVSSMAQLAPLFLFAWALCWLLIFSGRATRVQRRIIIFVFIPLTVLLTLGSLTDKSRAMTLVGVPVMALWYGRRKVPWVTLLLMLLILVFVIFPLFNTYRVLDPRLDQGTRLAMTSEIVGQWNSEEYLDASVGTVKRRLALVNSVAIVVRDVGRWVPYARGSTLFGPTLAFFIPRVVWPDKPSLTMGRDFGETFRVVHILDQTTRIAVTVPGELYWNFDLPGILLGMALWGVALRFLYRRYAESGTLDPVLCAIHLVLLVQFVHFGGGLAAQIVAVVRTTLVLEVFCWLGRRTGLLEHRPVA